MSAVDDAAILYLAVNGWGPPIACRFVNEEGEVCERADVVGISADDGAPYCEHHMNTEDDTKHRLAPEVLEEIKRRRLEHHKAAGEIPVEERGKS